MSVVYEMGYGNSSKLKIKHFFTDNVGMEMIFCRAISQLIPVFFMGGLLFSIQINANTVYLLFLFALYINIGFMYSPFSTLGVQLNRIE